MNINRHNYEEYFLLYVDNELSAADRQAVETFVAENPDLEEELVMMMQSVLRPDAGVVFKDKEMLFKNKANDVVSDSNCEEYFVLYGDDELTNEEKERVEQFVYKNPKYQADFEAIQQARLVPDHSIVYPDKNELYRTGQDERVAPFRWWRLAAAAVVILFLGAAGWYMTTDDQPGNDPTGVAQTKNNDRLPANKPEQVLPTPGKTGQGQVADAQQPETSTSTVVKPAGNQQAAEAVKRSKAVAKDEKNDKKKIIAPQRNIQEPQHVLQESLVQVKTKPVVEEPQKVLAPRKIDAGVMASLTGEPEVNASVAAVSLPVSEVVFTGLPDESEDEIKLANASLNKNSLRGLFRKVTRAFDNNEEPVEQQRKGIRIASFEIALK